VLCFVRLCGDVVLPLGDDHVLVSFGSASARVRGTSVDFGSVSALVPIP
jgi:hypothetical protein